jgi:hypothetical protein
MGQVTAGPASCATVLPRSSPERDRPIELINQAGLPVEKLIELCDLRSPRSKAS